MTLTSVESVKFMFKGHVKKVNKHVSPEVVREGTSLFRHKLSPVILNVKS